MSTHSANLYGAARLELSLRPLSALTAALLLAAALPSAAQAADPPARSGRDQCFFINQWNGWHAPTPTLLYIRVGISDIWRVDLNSECHMLRDPTAHLVTRVRGSETVCSAIDLDLNVQNSSGFTEPCFVKSLRKLTPDEAKALDRKDRP